MSERYGAIAIGLHWAIAILLIGNIFLGWNMHGPDGWPMEERFQLHKSIGITVLILTIVRIVWRFMNPPPALPDDMAGYEKAMSHLVHLGFYGLMLALPLTGWMVASASDFSISTVLFNVVSWPHLPILPDLEPALKKTVHDVAYFFHGRGSWLLLFLVGLHVAGALKHQLAGEEGVIKRMIPIGIFGKTEKPKAARGAVMSFGLAFGVFAAIAALPIVSGLQSVALGESSVKQSWVVNYEQSSIRFTGRYQGNAFTGEVGEWTANIAFDENALSISEVEVGVLTTSILTGTKLYDDTIKQGEWFNASDFPEIKVKLQAFERAGSAYEADMILSIKGVDIPGRFAFSLTEANGVTTMEGRAELLRDVMNIGMTSDPNGEWVGNSIEVGAIVVASPAD